MNNTSKADYPFIKTLHEQNLLLLPYDKHATFPGGLSAFSDYIFRHTKFPRKGKLAGKNCNLLVEFIIDSEGNVTQVNCPVTGKNDVAEKYGFTEVAKKLMIKSPKWVPAERDGAKVPERISFFLDFHWGYLEFIYLSPCNEKDIPALKKINRRS